MGLIMDFSKYKKVYIVYYEKPKYRNTTPKLEIRYCDVISSDVAHQALKLEYVYRFNSYHSSQWLEINQYTDKWLMLSFGFVYYTLDEDKAREAYKEAQKILQTDYDWHTRVVNDYKTLIDNWQDSEEVPINHAIGG